VGVMTALSSTWWWILNDCNNDDEIINRNMEMTAIDTIDLVSSTLIK